MPTTHEQERDQTTTEQLAILTLLNSMKRANYEKNVAAFAAAYTNDAAVYNLAPPLAHHGIDPAEKQAWFDSWEGPVEIESKDMQITVNGNFAYVHGYMHLSGTKKGVAQAVNFWMRETLCLEKRGEWKIVHEHTSVPFYMDASLRPAFDLKPE